MKTGNGFNNSHSWFTFAENRLASKVILPPFSYIFTNIKSLGWSQQILTISWTNIETCNHQFKLILGYGNHLYGKTWKSLTYVKINTTHIIAKMSQIYNHILSCKQWDMTKNSLSDYEKYLFIHFTNMYNENEIKKSRRWKSMYFNQNQQPTVGQGFRQHIHQQDWF